MSGSANSNAASATRMRQPPENSDAGRCWASWGKPKSGEDGGGAGGRGMGVNIGEPGLDFGNPMRVGRGFGFRQQTAALAVGGQHDFNQRLRPGRRLLRQATDAFARANGDAALLGGEYRR